MLGFILFVFLVVYIAASYIVYDRLSKVDAGGGDSADNTPAHFVVTDTKWAGFDTTSYEMELFDEVHFPSRQPGLALAGWFVPTSPDAPAIILTHGLNGCKCTGRMLTVAGMLHRNGFNVLLYDLRDHGQSDIEDGRAALGNEEYLDLLGAWDWLQQEKQFAPERIGAFGESLGAGTTLIAFGQEPRLTAAFVDSPYTDLSTIIDEELDRNHYPRFLVPGGLMVARVVAADDLLAFSPQDAILNDNGRPLYIVHGTGDTRINVHHSRDLAALATQTGTNLTTWIPKNIDHVNTVLTLPNEYERRLVTFFDHALRAGSLLNH